MKLIRAILLSCLMAVAGLSAHAANFSGWSKAMPITFAGYGKAETLTNFPVLVKLHTGLSGFSYTDFASPADGADLRFAASNQIDELNFEIEKWDTNGTSSVWVQIPLLAGTNTQIWAYWKNPAAAAPACQTNGSVWTNGFVGVWHLGEATATNFDSTVNRNDGVKMGNTTVAPTGMIGSAQTFDGAADGVNCGTGPSLDVALPRTISAWINPTVMKMKAGVVAKCNLQSSYNYVMAITNGGLFAYDGAWRTSSNVGLVVGNWYHVVYETRGDGLVQFYVNGQKAGTATWNYVDTQANNVYIGTWIKSETTYDFNGKIDEVSIANMARGSNWVWASYMSGASNTTFNTYGTAGVGALAVDASGATPGVTNATLNGLMIFNGGDPATETVFCWDTADKGTASTGAWAHVEAAGNSFTNGQTFANVITGLLPGGTYVYRCYATNSTGSAWSPYPRSLTTISLPAVTNTGADILSYNSALLKGSVTDTGTQTPSVWFLYWMDGSAVTNAVGVGPQSGACSNLVTDLVIGASNYVYMLMASNAAGVVYSGTNGFTTGRIYYVVTNGNNASDGLTWATAVSNVEVAVQRAGPVKGVVLLGDGNFAVTSTWIQVTNAILVTSLNGPASTSLDGVSVAKRRIMYVNHALARVSGFTMKRGSYNDWSDSNGPGALRLAAGMVSNCIVTANSAYYYGGVQLTGGVLVDSLIHANTAGGSGSGAGGGLGLVGPGEVINCVISNNNTSIYGGGVTMTGGRIRDCQIVKNRNTGTYEPVDGAGVYMSGGTLERCEVRDNIASAFQRGGGIFMSGGTVLNSLVVSNGCLFQGGGIFMTNSTARVIHTTVTGNRTGLRGHGIYQASGAVSNSLVIGNGGAYYGRRGENVTTVGGTISYSASTPLLPGANNIAIEPAFANASGGDYRLLPGSPCIDAAAAIPDITQALGGTARALDGNGDGSALPDMGAFELAPVSSLACAVSAPANEAQVQLEAILTAVVAGPDTNIVWYGWDIDNNGVWDYTGADKSTVTHTFGVGFFTVKLSVSNALEGATCIMTNYIRVAPLTNYVARTGVNANIPPYDTWEKATSNILDGVDAAWAMPGEPSTVLVSNGYYSVSRGVVLNGSISVRSLNGPTSTVVDVSSATFGLKRAFYVDSADAVLAGFTGRGGNGGGFGASGLWLNQGLVSNCIIAENSGYNFGTGAYMGGGKLSDTIVSYNTCSSLASLGGGLYMTAGVAERCTVLNNSNQKAAGCGLTMYGGLFTHGVISGNAPTHSGSASTGGGVLLYGGVIRNSLIVSNGNTYVTNGGGVAISGGIIESCTIATNRALTTGGGLAVNGGTVTNTIVAFNAAASQVNISGKTNNCYYSCATELTDGNNGNIVAVPTFQNRLAGNYRLASGSAGVNQGIRQDWMTGALDLAGERRLSGVVDMGAYEFPSVGGGLLIIVR